MGYYVLQVAPQEEQKTETHISKILPEELCSRCFHPTRLMRKKFRGKWVEVRERLLPGYVFVTTEDAKALYVHLKEVPFLTKMLGRDLEYFIPLTEREERWLDLLLKKSGDNGSDYEVGLSQIAVGEGNEVRIVSGLLKGMEGMIKKINLHRRIAEVEVPFMNGKTVIHLGIEMVEQK